ncbi:sugar ABC transporter ATP-binding protein [Rhizobium sp. LjRoot30]|uniref:sugar ABC transporter ATP-binding protein n=1 Tax=Rhizobium sp. LjRoot30 TaxID=3342320 RepID=UPI003ECE696D
MSAGLAGHVGDAPFLLEISGLSKSWGATRAVDRASFALGAGEVLALVGENGAGKSTLMALLSGVAQPDEGEIRLSGKQVELSSPQMARANGIATVFQELSLAENLTVMENIYAGRLPSSFGFVDKRLLKRRASELFELLGLAIDPEATVGSLPVSSRQIVEIAKAVSLDARVLLLDEPTSALNADEKAALFSLVGRLKAKGTGIIYISHHLDEVLDLADRVVVLRDGQVVSTTDCAGTDANGLVRDMTGRTIDPSLIDRRAPFDEVLLDIEGLGDGRDVEDIWLSLRRGEIVALAGLMGSGRSALAEMIVGLRKPSVGSIRLSGQAVTLHGMKAAQYLGIGYIPPERKTQGLFLDMSIAANVAAATLRRSTRAGFVDEASMRRRAQDYVGRLSIKAGDVGVTCRALSGGNQQKVLFAKWLETEPALLVIEEPTKGVDIAAKLDIHAELVSLAAGGAGILMVSSDLPEILSIAHRVLVMHRGRIVGDLDCRQTTEHQIVALASGLAETSHGI